MSTITIEEMRKVQEFITWNKWPNHIHTNCIAYALGIPIDDSNEEVFRNLLLNSSLEIILDELGFEYRKIDSESDLIEDEIGLVRYDYLFEAWGKLGDMLVPYKRKEVHIARIELDRSWSHKSDWVTPPCATSKEEIRKSILCKDNVDVEPTAYFAVRKPR